MRTKASFTKDAREAVRKGDAVNGVKGVLPFMMLQYIDPSTVFPVDWMHCVLLGVCKSLMSFWLNAKYKQKDFFIGDRMSLLNKRLLSIVVPDFVARKPRGMEDHAHWKASECREWLLHFSVPVLHGILPPIPYVHYLLLVTAITFLTKYGVTLAEVDQAMKLLEEFLKLYPLIYGRESQTMNVHLLKHLVFYVRQFGPLYTFSCFGFESMNCFIKNMVHGTRHVNNQICFAVGMSKQLAPLITRIINASDMMIGALAKRLGKKFLMENKLESQGDKIEPLGCSTNVQGNNCHYNLLTEVMKRSSPKLYLRVQKGDTVYYSKEYRRAKTFNAYSVCFLKNGNEKGFGIILCFIKVNNEVFAVMDVCETKPFTLEVTMLDTLCDVSATLQSLTDRLCPHFVHILSQNRKRLVNVKSLLMKC
ncbi:uncharacterized protein LOC110441075, partial [Mizuhopecten yessoensis]|uniref:uncharacterized protein LOC110441075 n=1 Tax=Mizuhopecten yessoensis TaxID=6573 RepID=UPI000B45D47E